MNNKVTVFAKESYKVQPWRNGQGSTLELACDEIQVAPYFNWRISIATLTEDGVYSAFAKTQRTQLMLTGESVHLYIDTKAQGSREVNLAPLSQCSFSGIDQVQCRLQNNVEAKMFNLMTLAGRYESRIQILDAADISALDLTCDVLLVYSLSDQLIVSVEQQDYSLRQAELLAVSQVSDQAALSINTLKQTAKELKIICVQLFLNTN